VLDIFGVTGNQIIESDDLMTCLYQAITNMRADETRGS
jgi:hypothetical protein